MSTLYQKRMYLPWKTDWFSQNDPLERKKTKAGSLSRGLQSAVQPKPPRSRPDAKSKAPGGDGRFGPPGSDGLRKAAAGPWGEARGGWGGEGLGVVAREQWRGGGGRENRCVFLGFSLLVLFWKVFVKKKKKKHQPILGLPFLR